MEITIDHLKKIIPTNREPEIWLRELNMLLPKYHITTVNRVAGFLAQTGHESMDFTRLEENLNYSWKALRRVWPRHFPTDDIAKQYHRRPEAIANRAYANRMGNGPENSGDGWRYRGKGIIQITGKNNHTNFGATINMLPEQVCEYLKMSMGAVEGACWYWKETNLNSTCDANDIVAMTKRINGGTHGLNDRIRRFKRAKEVLMSDGDNFGFILAVGHRGEEVEQLQRSLGIVSDGIFGPMTQAAVERWQEAQGFPVTGTIGKKQFQVLVV